MSRSIQLTRQRANALITGLMAAYGELQTASFNATREGRELDAELASFRLAVCDGLISDILGEFDVDGWPEIPQGKDSCLRGSSVERAAVPIGNDCCKPGRGITQ